MKEEEQIFLYQTVIKADGFLNILVNPVYLKSLDATELENLYWSSMNNHTSNYFIFYRIMKYRLYSSLNYIIYEVWQKSNETDFYLPKFFNLNLNVIFLKIVPLGNYTPMETLLPLLVAALEIFNRYDLQHIRYTLHKICSSSPQRTSFRDFRKHWKECIQHAEHHTG